jgi:hypothetical protein
MNFLSLSQRSKANIYQSKTTCYDVVDDDMVMSLEKEIEID